MSRTIVGCSPAIAVLVIAGCGDGSPPGVVPERVGCPNCEIVMAEVATIGDAAGDGTLPGRPTGVWLDGRGRYWINVLDAVPVIYDPVTGGLDPIGRSGEGPGEFRFPRIRSMLPGDSVLVSDLGAFVVIDPERQVARQIRGDTNSDGLAVIDWPGNVLFVTSLRDPAARTTRTVVARHDLSRDVVAAGDTVVSTEPNSGRGAEWANSFRRLGEPTGTGELWMFHYNHYRLERVSRTGGPQDSVVRRPAWFPGGEPLRIGGPGQPTTPHMIGNWVDEDGRLWTLSARPRADTREAWSNLARPDGQVAEARVAALPAAYELNETMIEVIDPAAGRVIARHMFDGYIIGILPGQRVASFVETDIGIPIITIHELTLRGLD